MSKDEWETLDFRAGTVFSPAAPIREKDVFAGRRDQIRAAIDAINQAGQHAAIYGERGVGKTSLANVIHEFILSTGQTKVIAPHINCDSHDNFSKVWLRVFDLIPITDHRPGFGFSRETQTEVKQLSKRLGDEVTPADVFALSELITGSHLFVPIIDEFDRLNDQTTIQLFTDTIKMLSDQSRYSTIILVGVADTIDELIQEHRSIERALLQIRMPRMHKDELIEILVTGSDNLGMQFTDDARNYIALLSQGLPHYGHLLGLNSCRDAIEQESREVDMENVDGAIDRSIKGAQQTLLRAYHMATTSPRKDSLYVQVLLACAIAETDELGYFAAAAVRDPMSAIMQRAYDIPQFSQHLKAFCTPMRGPVLERIGEKRRYRFRFKSPLLQPYLIMQGLANNLIDQSTLAQLLGQEAAS